MLINHADIRDLVIPGNSDLGVVSLPAPPGFRGKPAALAQIGLKVGRGRMVVNGRGILPIVGEMTSIESFCELNPAKLHGLLDDPGPSRGLVRDAVIVAGHPHYYHFMVNHLPGLILLAMAQTDPAVWATAFGCPAPVAGFLGHFLASIAAPRAARTETLPHGVYEVQDVIFAARPRRALPPVIGSQMLLPLALKLTGIADPLRELGPIKLFVRREDNKFGRNLVNQAEIEEWFTARGFTAVNPGGLAFTDQVMLFARATHIAGVEGGALTNLMFAVNARAVTMVASSSTANDRFFQGLVKDRDLPFQSFYGAPVLADRNADFSLPVQVLEGLDRSFID